jgi:r-opsin
MNSRFMEEEPELHLMGWNLTPEDLIHIPEHWLSYPEVRSIYHYILAFMYSILFSLGVIGNGLVLWIFCV